jgi:hypothetical protein
MNSTPPTNLRSASLFRLIVLLVICFCNLSVMQAVTPAPDGGYPGANTAEGTNALFSRTNGTNNTALGSEALFSVTFGIQNTATGAQALKSNIASQNTADCFQALTRNTTGRTTRLLGGARCLATQSVPRIRPAGFKRSIQTSLAAVTRHMVIRRSSAAVTTILPSAPALFGPIFLAAETRPSVPERLLATWEALTTRPPGPGR